MSTYIFAIGGTGARVLRSLTMLLASGVRGTATNKEIVPVIIDYDGDNGDTKRTQDIMETYQKIHDAAYKNRKLEHSEHFFCTPLNKLRDKVGDQTIFHDGTRYNIFLDGVSDGSTYSKYIGYDDLRAANGTEQTRHLMESLYSTEPAQTADGNDNPKAELHMKLHHGFRGCPNIGCIVTKQLAESNELKQLPGIINAGDRIFIIGSIFGGTGASGIPMLLDFFKKGAHQQQFQSNKVGVLAVTPYFGVDNNGTSPINSDTFVAKTKAALKAYESTVYQTADAVYIVGDDKTNGNFPNHEGGKEQKNNAHVAELVGAMMALDFIDQEETELTVGSVFEFGLENNHDHTTPLVYRDFWKEATAIPYFDPMARFVIFRHFCTNFFFKPEKWQKNDIWLGDKDSGIRNKKDFRDLLKAFFKDFGEWIKEMEDPKYRPFKLFNLNESDYCKLLEYLTLRHSGFLGDSTAFGEDDIREALGSSNGDPSKKNDGSKNWEKYAGHPEELFMVNAYNALNGRETDGMKALSIQNKIDNYLNNHK